MTTTMMPVRAERLRPVEMFGMDTLLEDDERDIAATVRRFVDTRLRPDIAGWFESATLPRELAKEFGELGLLGMHLDGYGCAGTNAVSYGLACLELEAGDSGFRSFVSVQGSLSMFSIHRFGSDEQKQEWLPRLASGEAIGCFGLTEADFGSNPAGMRTRARRDGSDWILTGTKMWITNGGLADVATVWAQTDEGIRGSWCRPTRPASPRTPFTKSCPCGPRSPPNSCSTRSACLPLRNCRTRSALARRCRA